MESLVWIRSLSKYGLGTELERADQKPMIIILELTYLSRSGVSVTDFDDHRKPRSHQLEATVQGTFYVNYFCERTKNFGEKMCQPWCESVRSGVRSGVRSSVRGGVKIGVRSQKWFEKWREKWREKSEEV